MHIEKPYKLKTWTDWDYQVCNAVLKFRDETGVTPNALVVNLWTLSQIEFITSNCEEHRNNTFMLDPVTKKYTVPLEKNEPANISSFCSEEENFDLTFYFNEEFKDKEFNLFFTDEEDDDDDEEDFTPVDSPVLIEELT